MMHDFFKCVILIDVQIFEQLAMPFPFGGWHSGRSRRCHMPLNRRGRHRRDVWTVASVNWALSCQRGRLREFEQSIARHSADGQSVGIALTTRTAGRAILDDTLGVGLLQRRKAGFCLEISTNVEHQPGRFGRFSAPPNYCMRH